MTISIALLLACIGESVDDSTSTTDTEQSSDDTGTGDTGNKDTGSSDTGTEDTGVEDTGDPVSLDRFSGEYELFDAPGLILGDNIAFPVGHYVSRGGENAHGVHTVWLNSVAHESVFAWEQGVSGEQTVDGADFLLEDPYTDSYSYFGYDSVADQDLTGDGVADLAVLAPGWGAPTRVTLFEGHPSGASVPYATLTGSTTRFGISIAALQGDSPQVAVTGSSGGGVYLFDSPSGEVALEDHDAHLTKPAGWDDVEVDRTGDLNGDGVDDLVVSSRDRVYVVLGPISGTFPLADAEATVLSGELMEVQTAFGRGGGDIDDDGRADLLVGSPWSQSEKGVVGVFMQELSGTVAVTDADALLQHSGSDRTMLGYGVDAAGDVDADGHGDVIVGAPSPLSGGGEAFLWYGPLNSGVHYSDDADARFYSNTAGANFGTKVLGLGDTNGDGGSDLLITAPSLRGTGSYSNSAGAVGVWSL